MITGKKISLRGVEIEDAEQYFLWINDQETNFWRGLYPPHSKKNALDQIQKYQASDSSSITYTITKESKAIGFVGLRSICNRSRRAEIWIYLGDKNSWNQGIGQDSLETMVDYAFNEMNLHRIWLECNPEFESGVACYIKVGFEKEGILKDGYFRRGQFRNTMIMGLIRQYTPNL